MLIFVGEPHYKIITVEEGTGDNLFPADRAEGLVDYVMSSVYEQDGDQLRLVDSGQIMFAEYVASLREKDDLGEDGGLIRRVLEYWELDTNEYTILDR